MNKREFSDAVSAVCKRPGMYTLHGSLVEVIAHLDGYGRGVSIQPYSHWGLSGFFGWLARKLGKDARTPWDTLLLSFGDEEAALTRFAQLYREYAELETFEPNETAPAPGP